jgi:hypothetical protein
MPKGRIGLSLDEDVLVILNKCGRGKERACFSCHGQGSKVGGTAQLVTSVVCPMCGGTGIQSDSRPTRTEIIQTAIREWYARQCAQSNGGAVEQTDIQAQRQEAYEFGVDLKRRLTDKPTDIQTDSKPVSKPKRVKGETVQKRCHCGHLAAMHLNSKGPCSFAGSPSQNSRSCQCKHFSLPSETVKEALPQRAGHDDLANEQKRLAECIHPSGNRTAGKNWRCTACGFQNVAG